MLSWGQPRSQLRSGNTLRGHFEEELRELRHELFVPLVLRAGRAAPGGLIYHYQMMVTGVIGVLGRGRFGRKLLCQGKLMHSKVH